MLRLVNQPQITLYLLPFRTTDMNSIPHTDINQLKEERVEDDCKNFNVENLEMCIKGEVTATPIDPNEDIKVPQYLEDKSQIVEKSYETFQQAKDLSKC